MWLPGLYNHRTLPATEEAVQVASPGWATEAEQIQGNTINCLLTTLPS